MAWTEVDDSTTASSNTVITVKDENFTITDGSDTTKAVQFQVSGVTTATTRTLTVPDASTTIVGTDATQTLTNKTLTAPTLTTPALGTPASGTLTNCTGLPVDTGISGLGANVAAFLATPSSANLATAVTDETGSGGALVFASSPTITTPTIASFTNATHNHTNAAGGGQITTAALSDFTAWTDFTPSRTADSGTWTAGTVTSARYMKLAKLLIVNVEITASTVSATPNNLAITIPGGFTANKNASAALSLSDNGTAKTGTVSAIGGTTSINLYTAAARTGTWATATTNTSVYFTLMIETTA